MVDKLRDKLLKTKLVEQLMGFSVVGVVVTLFSMALMYLFNEWLSINVFVTYVLVYILSILLSYFFVIFSYKANKCSSRSSSVWKGAVR